MGKAASRVGAAQNFMAANREVGVAERALEAARASGDRDAIAHAEVQLEEAKKFKKSSIFDGLSTAATMASDQLGDGSLKSGLGYASRGLSATGSISRGDYVSAGIAGLGVAASTSKDAKLQELSQAADAGNNYRHSLQAEVRANIAGLLWLIFIIRATAAGS